MKTRTSLLCAGALLLVTPVLSFAADDAAVVYAKESLYQDGSKAYREKNYVTALKNLFAFQVLNEVALGKKPDFAETLRKAVADCEAHLRPAESTPGYWGTAAVPKSIANIATPAGHFIDVKGHAIDPDVLKEFHIDADALAASGSEATPIVIFRGRDGKLDEAALKKNAEALRKAFHVDAAAPGKKE